MKKSKYTGLSGLPVTPEALDARPDSVDFRDKMYTAPLVEVPLRISLETYQSYYPKKAVPVLDQGQEGACTGFGLAAVANCLLRRRKVIPDPTPVSPRMFYEMARRYDEWPGEDYSGSSARGAMKGWHKHGVCASALWPGNVSPSAGALTHQRAVDAAQRPLGAYFRVNHGDLSALHSALAETGILYATAFVHEGWGQVDRRTGLIPGPAGKNVLGGHAFALVGFDEQGFWLQNSWGPHWGFAGGFALLTYEDWLAHGTDVWVARLGAPVILPETRRRQTFASRTRTGFSFAELHPHIISIGNQGQLRNSGTFGTTPDSLAHLFADDFPRLTRSWPKKRLLFYAHGGLVEEDDALQRIADYRQPLLDAQVYPLAFIWHSGFWTTVTSLLQDAFASRRPEGFLDAAKDFLLDRLDDTLEPIARPWGKMMWEAMKNKALQASASNQGGARQVLLELGKLLASEPELEIHVAGHSAGSIFMAPFIEAITAQDTCRSGPARGLAGLGRRIQTCTLWAPACTMNLFHQAYLPAIQNGRIGQFTLFTLKDRDEQGDNCARIYNKSLLYLIANAFEEKTRFFRGDGEPLLGLEKFILQDPAFKVDPRQIKNDDPAQLPLFGLASATWVRSPNGLPEGQPSASRAAHHGDFDDDPATVRATLARLLDAPQTDTRFAFNPSPAARRDQRKTMVN